MSRRNARHGMRVRIAAAAARIMAEDGIDDFGLAKRRAARVLGAPDTESLPANEEVEAALRDYLALYQAQSHPERVEELRQLALEAMESLEQFHPYLTGPVLSGLAGPYASIDLQLFPESSKDVELFLLGRNIEYQAVDERRWAGDRAHDVAVITVDWKGVPMRLTLFDRRDERMAIKTTPTGRVAPRAGIGEVRDLLGSGDGIRAA